jgi:NADH:quinone reductase (non-electrogenic)
MSAKRIVILGGGFGGLAVARALRRADAEILITDRRNHHVFQPLLYQVATAVLSPSEVAAPLRQLAQQQPNLAILLGEVTDIELACRRVKVSPPGLPPMSVGFDYLVVATGVRPSYFGHDEFAQFAPSLKTITDAERDRPGGSRGGGQFARCARASGCLRPWRSSARTSPFWSVEGSG